MKKGVIILMLLGVLAFAGYKILWDGSASRDLSPGGERPVYPLTLADELVYDQVSWICSHNAMSNSQDRWMLPNQGWNIPTQLERGIHAQMWDVWEKGGELVLQHANRHIALPGSIKLSQAIGFVVEYLNQHPQAVITLILESYVDNEKVREVFKDAGAGEFCLVHPPGRAWPTLGELRASNKRLLIFTDRPDGEDKWPMPVWKHCVETPWEAKSKDDLKAAYNRGNKDNALFIVNHFITNPFPSRKQARELNSAEALKQRGTALREGLGRTVNFWTLDFVDEGSLTPPED